MQSWLIGRIALAMLMVAACSGPAEQRPEAGTSPDQSAPPASLNTTAESGTGAIEELTQTALHVTVTQYRLDEGTRKINAQLTNRGAAPVTVTGVRLVWAGARRLPPTPKDTVVAPGQTVDLQTRYGSAYCRSLPARHASFRVTMQGGTEVTLAVDRAGRRLLGRLGRADCAARQLRQTASISFGLHYRQVIVAGEEWLRGALIVRRASAVRGRASPVYVEDLLGSVLLTLRPAVRAALPAKLSPGDEVLTIPVLIGSTHRCDAHALSQSSQTFLLSVFARVGNHATQRVIVSPDRAAQGRAGALLDRVCD